MNKLLLGRFIPGDSFVHRLDPRAKLLTSFYFIIIIFFCNNFVSFGVMFLFVLAAILASKINLGFFIKGVKPLIWLILFTVSLQILFTTGGEVYFKLGFLTVSEFGLVNGAYIFFRFVLIILMSTLLTLTTAPLSLSDAIEYLLRPLKAVKFPAHETSMMLSIALRFVPTLMDETEKIMNAQRARGVDFNEGNLMQKMKAIVPLLIPLFVSAFDRAEDLALAMEARGYRGGEGRSKYRVLRWTLKDTLIIVSMVVLTALLMWVRN
ncbi:energy-coupling factor transporter transmembrane component T family protein [Vagococcus silagei]|uniref:Energy-coupling factor transporter transmembrane protein EcfT n=1 Tax=Vagococcus silagei TaxID=2508885 RepID=A0A4S3B4K6_9ENTE|nr:energy-coupling factor transporter transmembrane protein EcfT [Vagococcus silagei]THB61428.1 energy-coupling factor transporter transmembrane protein EcfT [Vagococcus silagei]